jgi:hypothetical protein
MVDSDGVSIELRQVDWVRSRSARPAVESIFDDESLTVLLTTEQLENVWPRLDMVRAHTSTTEPADPDSALAAMPTVHQALSASPILAGEVGIETNV